MDNRFVTKFLWLCGVVVLSGSPLLLAQTAASPSAFDAGKFLASRPAEIGAFAESGFGVEQNSDAKFFSLGVHAGKVLTPAVGPGLLRGQFEIGVEVVPFWQAYTPRQSVLICAPDCGPAYQEGGTFTGISIVPANFRWDFTRGKKFVPWLQGAGGLIYTTHKFPSPPADTSVWNFSPQFGVGTHYFLRPRRSLDFSANAVHISSSSLGDKNPGINASVMFTVGYSWWK
jgi:lipid A 3-O-deacylase